jgi:hypothetical protein
VGVQDIPLRGEGVKGSRDAVEENLGDFSGARGMSTPLPVTP